MTRSYRQENTGVASGKLCESFGMAQSKSRPEPNRAYLERPENGFVIVEYCVKNNENKNELIYFKMSLKLNKI